MQSLEMMNELKREVEKHEYEIPEHTLGIDARVEDGEGAVLLTLDGKQVAMSIYAARDLALALRQSANRIEKEGYRRNGTLRKR